MLWQHISSLFSHFGFIALIVAVVIWRKSTAERAVFIKLIALWAIISGFCASIAAVMVIHEDHLLTISMWGHHGFREMIIAIGCSILAMSLIGLGFSVFRRLTSAPY